MLKLSNRYTNPQKQARLNELIEQNSSQIINIFGYTLLAFALLDYASLIIPPQLMNPNWEFQTIGGMVEMSWATLLGLILVFYRRQDDYVKSRELGFLSLISWLCLVMAIAYFITIPILLSSCLRISSSNTAKANNQLTIYSEQIQAIESKLGEASETDLQRLIATIPNEAKMNLTTNEFREKLLAENTSKQKAASKQIRQELKQQQRSLYKNAVKWTIGAFLTGASALFIWKSTCWSRVLRRET